MGTYGSRPLAVGGSALVKALGKITDKARKIAAHLMEASESDIEFKDGTFRVAGTDKSIDLDRKSAVKGKSVSVRVDPGGRRIIQKKTTHNHPTPHPNTPTH